MKIKLIPALIVKAIRGNSGQFAHVGSRGHLEQHRRAYHQAKQDGKIKGSRADYQSHMGNAWDDEKDQQHIDLLQTLHHAEADLLGATGNEKRRLQRLIQATKKRIARLNR